MQNLDLMSLACLVTLNYDVDCGTHFRATYTIKGLLNEAKGLRGLSAEDKAQERAYLEAALNRLAS